MRRFLVSLLLTVSITQLIAQQPGSIEIRKNFWGTTYRQNDQKLSAAGLMEKLKDIQRILNKIISSSKQ